MTIQDLDSIKLAISKLTDSQQDYLAGFLLMERLRRNSLQLRSLSQRIDDADPENWESMEKTESSMES